MRKENQSSRVVGERIGHKEGNEAWGELASHLKLLAALSYPLSLYLYRCPSLLGIVLKHCGNSSASRVNLFPLLSMLHVITENATNFWGALFSMERVHLFVAVFPLTICVQHGIAHMKERPGPQSSA